MAPDDGEEWAHAIGFILRLARALHTYGYAAQPLEEVMALASFRLGMSGEFFSTPTSIFAAFGERERQKTYLLRVEPGDVDLGKLARLDQVTVGVLRATMRPAEGSRRIDAIVADPPRYGPVMTTAAFGIASGSAARLFGGGLNEMAAAAGIGVVIGLLALLATRVRGLAHVFEPIAAFIASFTAAALGARVLPLSSFLATLAGLIVLVPGLTLTIAMTEISTRHLVSGTARLSGAVMLFLGIAFGVAFGSTLALHVFGPGTTAQPVALPAWTNLIALALAALGFVVLLKAEPVDAPWIILTGALGFYGSRIGAATLGPELGTFVGALIAGIASNIYARLRDRPATVALVPGILLLVPGSIGYRSLASLLRREVVLGVETAFQMMLIAVALVAGMLIANIVSPHRRLD
jgi:uncharacterized membrane protein YjjP (DUF1212 family)